MHVIVVTGRMFRAVRPYLAEAGLDDPVVCYQGALVADPVTGEFLRHIPIPRAGRARGDRRGRSTAGFHLNCYVDDELYVAAETPEAHAYADLNKVPRCTSSATCASGCTTSRRSSSRSATRTRSTSSRRR